MSYGYFANRCAGRIHVASSNITAIRAARVMFNAETKASNDPEVIKARKAFYREVLAAHAANRDIVEHFRL